MGRDCPSEKWVSPARCAQPTLADRLSDETHLLRRKQEKCRMQMIWYTSQSSRKPDWLRVGQLELALLCE